MNTPFTEVADRVWVSRRPWLDTTVGLVGGRDGLLLVDAHGSSRSGQAVVEDVEALGVGPVTAVVTTHWHFDHTFGLDAVVRSHDHPPVWAHEAAAEEFAKHAAEARRARSLPDHPESDGHHDDVAATELVAPTHTFSSVRTLDLGDRIVELVHPGRGHTGGDLVVNVPDADVVLAGDLVEESGPPSWGPDSWPLEWPLALDVLLTMLRPSALVVPGHGAPVDRDFVTEQRALIGTVAETVRDLAARGVRETDAVTSAQWPLPTEALGHAVTRAYAQLPRSQKRLPLV